MEHFNIDDIAKLIGNTPFDVPSEKSLRKVRDRQILSESDFTRQTNPTSGNESDLRDAFEACKRAKWPIAKINQFLRDRFPHLVGTSAWNDNIPYMGQMGEGKTSAIDEAKTKKAAHGGGHKYDELDSGAAEFKDNSKQAHQHKSSPGKSSEAKSNPGEGGKGGEKAGNAEKAVKELKKVDGGPKNKAEPGKSSEPGVPDTGNQKYTKNESTLGGVINFKTPDIVSLVHGSPSDKDLDILAEIAGGEWEDFDPDDAARRGVQRGTYDPNYRPSWDEPELDTELDPELELDPGPNDPHHDEYLDALEFMRERAKELHQRIARDKLGEPTDIMSRGDITRHDLPIEGVNTFKDQVLWYADRMAADNGGEISEWVESAEKFVMDRIDYHADIMEEFKPHHDFMDHGVEAASVMNSHSPTVPNHSDRFGDLCGGSGQVWHSDDGGGAHLIKNQRGCPLCYKLESEMIG